MLESKRRAIVFLVLAVILAAVSGFLILQKVQSLNDDLGTMVTVYTASTDIPSRKIITPSDVRTDEVPQRYVRDEFITDVNELVDQVSVIPLANGEIITENMLKDASSVTEQENRLVSVLRSDQVYFDEELTALDRVDIIVSHDFDDEPITEVFMEDVQVARVAHNDSGFSGVQLEIPFDKVTDLVHMQNYADSMRVLKANVSEEANQSTEPIEEDEQVEDEDLTDEESDSDEDE
ncbi:Flp pilus assembly protein CpaB [Alkalibacillus haloalkaliphilus]|uniref:SAF domain-containing protein n=1 Tax=Alkalibacillus haloalkaliphilus TaxID=94136 RepID=A0A511W596_9BACI|nr:SAF domain-containing protein [Alkalibacillus haloalkaliphilus]GEN44532.1 hypothetical protein AHA02nite_03080 [Alkalibacillus haloalkaliphilus]